MFRGNHPAKVDEKGRLKIPSAFKQLLDAANVTQFYITSTNGRSAQVWPLPEWEKQESLLAVNAMNPVVEKYMNVTSYYGQQVEIDSQARVLLPQILREKAKLSAEVSVFGKLIYLEVHNEKEIEEQLSGSGLTADDLNAVAAFTRRAS
ncbi:MAG: division/cell wall cluster transcriptional repressor MraZ [Terracidiphilus sp.]